MLGSVDLRHLMLVSYTRVYETIQHQARSVLDNPWKDVTKPVTMPVCKQMSSCALCVWLDLIVGTHSVALVYIARTNFRLFFPPLTS